ncbi:FAD-dependent oxidoreductase [Bradyrhizobium sp. 14AA]
MADVASADPHASDDDAIAIVGAGQAGARAAEALRAAGHKGTIAVIGEERHLPYERPQLSKQILIDRTSVPASIKEGAGWHALGVDLHLGTQVASCSLDRRKVELVDGRRIAFDRLVLATGVTARALPQLDGEGVPVHTLRTVEDALLLRKSLLPGKRIVLIGGGVIGLEVASAAIKSGCAVTVVEAADSLLSRALPGIVADFLQKRHESAGVQFRFGSSCRAVVDGNLVLSDGSRIPADCVVVGIGAAPRVDLGRQVGLECSDGIRVDARGRSAAPGVYAIGDVAAQWSENQQRWLRVETWANAQNQSMAVARSMVGPAPAYNEAPWFWTDQYEINIQVAGDLSGAELVLRGDPRSGRFAVLGLKDGTLCGAITVNNRKDMAVLRKLATRPVNRADLENPSFDLRKALV